MEWAKGIQAEYGSTGEFNPNIAFCAISSDLRGAEIVNYLLTHRLQWGKPDTLSILPSRLNDSTTAATSSDPATAGQTIASSDQDTAFPAAALPSIPADTPTYFTADTPPELISIIMNDWPYSGEFL